jgi:hypothetical protein
MFYNFGRQLIELYPLAHEAFKGGKQDASL